MTLLNPNAWRIAEEQLAKKLGEGESRPETLRALRQHFSVLDLKRAVEVACNVGSSEAARIIAHEVTSHELP